MSVSVSVVVTVAMWSLGGHPVATQWPEWGGWGGGREGGGRGWVADTSYLVPPLKDTLSFTHTHTETTTLTHT